MDPIELFFNVGMIVFTLVVLQALEEGILKCLNLCVEQRFHTVAFPVIGPGRLLKFNMADAIQLLTGKICQFASSASSKFLSAVHIVIKPDDPNSEEVTLTFAQKKKKYDLE